MPVPLIIESQLDERSATSAAARVERLFADAGRDAGRQFTETMGSGLRDSEREIKRVADSASDAYDKVRDAAGRVAVEEEKLARARESGNNTRIVSQAEALERARRAEARAIRDATDAYNEYERAAEQAGNAGEDAGNSITGGLRGAAAAASGAGREAADGFMSGFSGAATLARIGAAGGPIGIALAAAAALGVTTGKVLADNISAGLESLATKDVFQARLGVDPATMARYGTAAANAYTDAWGESVPDNLATIQAAIQGGVIGRDATNPEIETTIGQMQALAQVMGVDVSEAARASGQLIRGGFAQDGTQAADIIANGFQRGLNVAGDWLDTITEYSTQFRKLGLDGPEAMGLIQQGLEGAARDSDVVADSLKEFSIRAVNGSKSTAEGFAALGFSADDMAAKIAQGGPVARGAFGEVLQAIRDINDPLQQGLIWSALFGTQFEDMGDAINKMDLSKARSEFTGTEGTIDKMTETLSAHTNQWDVLGRQIDTTFGKLQEWLANTKFGEFFSQTLPGGLSNLLSSVDTSDAEEMRKRALEARQEADANPIFQGDFAPPALPGSPGTPPPANSFFGNSAVPAPPAPPPSDRGPVTPILTETQAEAQKEAEKAQKEAEKAAAPKVYDPALWQVTAPAMYGDPVKVNDAATALSEAKLKLLELQDQENVKQSTMIAAQNNVVQAEQKLREAQAGTWKKANENISGAMSDLQSIFAPFDDDFGLSDGLPGVVKNLTTLLGNFALAGAIKGSPDLQMAAMSLMSGPAGSSAASTTATSPYGSAVFGAASSTGVGSIGAYPGDAALLANVPAGRYGQDADRNLLDGLSDCSSSIGDLVAILDGNDPNSNANLTTHNAASMLPGMGFQRGEGGPGDFRVGYNSGHMQATLPGGTNWNWGSNEAAAARGQGGSQGAYDPAFTDHWYRPVASAAPSPIAPSPSAMGPTALQPTWQSGAPAGLPATAPSGEGFGLSGAPLGPGLGGSVGGAGFQPPGVGGAAGTSYGNAVPSSGGQGGIGANSDMVGMIGGAADMVAPGSSIALKLANRAIQYGSQAAAIGVQGAIETFLPAGSPLASGSWFGKLVGGLAGAKPAAPNTAGGKVPPGAQHGASGGAAPGPGNSVNITNNVTNQRATEDGTARDLETLQMASWSR